MLPLGSIYSEGLKKPSEKQFQSMFVDQGEKAKNSIFDVIHARKFTAPMIIFTSQIDTSTTKIV